MDVVDGYAFRQHQIDRRKIPDRANTAAILHVAGRLRMR